MIIGELRKGVRTYKGSFTAGQCDEFTLEVATTTLGCIGDRTRGTIPHKSQLVPVGNEQNKPHNGFGRHRSIIRRTILEEERVLRLPEPRLCEGASKCDPGCKEGATSSK